MPKPSLPSDGFDNALLRRDHKGDMMAFTASALRHGKLLAATAFTLGLLTSASYAYTDEQQQMCTSDAMRLCSSEIPDVDRVTACMIRQRALLSDGCKAVFHHVPPAAAQPAGYAPATKPAKPLNLTPHKRG
ncbi:hypothetical protein A6X20_03830 [Bradyrhizobium elkanii]|nr:hypothetical protein A6X20_03830 [Bradyrhizobium elkanii]ODM83930.1 hypothetical protein A6452_14055 [Bradyrhizobium elkanii]